MTYLLTVENLSTEFEVEVGTVKAVDQVSFAIRPNEIMGLVGESGSGKSVTSLSIMQLVPSPPGHIRSGRITLAGKELLQLDDVGIRKVRGADVSMIFQEPMTSLNPVHKIGRQLAEIITVHRKVSAAKARDEVIAMLKEVGIPEPERRYDQYPHELSGGMRQRMMIAMALLNRPKLLIADEPTTALDVTIQAQILRLIKRLQGEMGMSVLLITHDLGVIAETCDYVCVMYAGEIVEKAPVLSLFQDPSHPYTAGLLRSIPSPLSREERLQRAAQPGGKRQRFPVIKGMVPELHKLPVGCRFADRCDFVQAVCRERKPELVAFLEGARAVRCHFPLSREKPLSKEPLLSKEQASNSSKRGPA